MTKEESYSQNSLKKYRNLSENYTKGEINLENEEK